MHTKGEWLVRVERPAEGGWRASRQVVEIRTGQTLIAYCVTDAVEFPETDRENEDNAILMAAAPKLLALLRDAYAVLGNTSTDFFGRHEPRGQELLSRIRDAVAALYEIDRKDLQDDCLERHLALIEHKRRIGALD